MNFLDVELPPSLTEELTARYGLELNSGHVIAWLLEREIAKYNSERAKVIPQAVQNEI